MWKKQKEGKRNRRGEIVKKVIPEGGAVKSNVKGNNEKRTR